MKAISVARSVILLTLYAVAACAAASSSDDVGVRKSVKVSLETPWAGTSLQHETAEFMATQDATLFWSWAESGADIGSVLSSDCVADMHTRASALLTPFQLRVLSASLGSRQHSAALETKRLLRVAAENLPRVERVSGEVGPAGCCLVAIGCQRAETEEELRRALLQESGERDASCEASTIQAFDAEFAPSHELSTSTTSPSAVLYAPMGASCAPALHALLREASEEGKVRFAWRLAGGSTCSSSPCSELGLGPHAELPGWGMEMALKNLEYSARNDAEGEQALGAGDRGKEEEEEEEGKDEGPSESGQPDEDMALAEAAARASALVADSHLLPRTLLQALAGSGDDALAAMARLGSDQVAGLGLRAASLVLSSSDPQASLATLQALSSHFPRFAATLAQTPVRKGARAAARQLQHRIRAGTSLLSVNGLLKSTSDPGAHALVALLEREAALAAGLARAGLSPAQARAAALLRGSENDPGLSGGAPRLSLPSRASVSVRDVERDPRTARWPRSLRALLTAGYSGSMPSVRRSLLTLVLVLDPCSPAGLEAASTVQELLVRGWPLTVRFALVPESEEEAKRAGGQDEDRATSWGSAGDADGDDLAALASRSALPGAYMTRVFHAVRAARDGAAAAAFLAECREVVWDLRAMRRSAEPRMAASDVDRAAVRAWLDARGGEEEEEEEEEEEQDDFSGDRRDVRAAQKLEAALDRQGGDWRETAARTERAVREAGLLPALAQHGALALLNGELIEAGQREWAKALMRAAQDEMQALQADVYSERLRDDDEDMHQAVLELRGALPRLNERIYPTQSDALSEYLALVGRGAKPGEERKTAQLEVGEGTLKDLRSLGATYWASAGAEESDRRDEPFDAASVTHWVVANPDCEEGLALVLAAAEFHGSRRPRAQPRWRLALLLHAPTESPSPFGALVDALASSASPPPALVELLNACLVSATPCWRLSRPELDRLVPGAHFPDGARPELARARRAFVERRLGVARGGCALVTNGRAVYLSKGEALVAGDLSLATLFAQSKQFAGAAAALVAKTEEKEKEEIEEKAKEEKEKEESEEKTSLAAAQTSLPISSSVCQVADLILRVSSLLASSPVEESERGGASFFRTLRKLEGGALTFNVPGRPLPGSVSDEPRSDRSSPLLIQALLDPLSKEAAYTSALLSWASRELGADIEVTLSPRLSLASMPLKAFYAYASPPSVFGHLDEGEQRLEKRPDNFLDPLNPRAQISELPQQATLTLGLHVPELWLVGARSAAADLDNVIPAREADLEARFALEALLVTGSAIDLVALESGRRNGTYPRGVQLELARSALLEDAQNSRVDTLVMSNLGYFQLKALPGTWSLALAPGRSRDLFDVEAAVASAGHAAASGRALRAAKGALPLALTRLTGQHMFLFLKKRAHRLTEDVLEALPPAALKGGLLSSLSSWVGRASAAEGTGDASSLAAARRDERETIHVFTIASGHMYERLQKIMMLSAVKRTPARLKFWFIKNYMSPQMMAMVPHMAAQYGFEFELVTYKWPTWLHKQTEKQRIIWAYKILFLDVLFPLGLDKVIFCDSDQVIRTDLRDLWHMDLKGAPYGYTPFCDNTPEMDGFRFWKQGFWKTHLMGRPYHISALYVVDLLRFRQLAAGDRLRVIYDNLSRDPNSLANLDQDLPNYAQEDVPIFSLPQEWLWCETWCGASTRSKAKTIDLCNNPMTKEPKLQGARRIIAEWPALDREATLFTEKIERALAGKGPMPALPDPTLPQVRLEPMVEGVVGPGIAELEERARKASPEAEELPAYDSSEL